MAILSLQTTSGRRSGWLSGGVSSVCLALALGSASARAAVTFSDPVNIAVGDGPQDIVAADLNNDGLPDLVIAANSARSVVILLNNPLNPGSFLPPVPYSLGVNPSALVIADFDGDGKQDIAAVNPLAKSVSILMNEGAGVFRIAATYAGGSSPVGIAAGILTASGRPDIVIADTAGVVNVLRNTGSGSFASATSTPVGSYPRSVVVADVDGDGFADVVAGNTGDRSITILKGDGTGALTRQLDVKVGGIPYSVHAMPVGSSGLVDLVAANYSGGGLMHLPAIGGGRFAEARYTGGGSGNIALGLGDFNSDGVTDVASANYFSKDVGIFSGSGNGLTAPMFIAPNAFRNGIAVADFNNDGLPDVVVTNNGNTITLLLNNSVFVGGFTLRSSSVPAGMATRATITLTSKAPSAGTTIPVSVSGSAGDPIATAPPAVNIPPGETSVSFDVVGWREGTAVITAEINGRPQQVSLVVGPPPGDGGPKGLSGDLDGDGRITINDAVMLLRAANGDGDMGS